MGEKNTAAAPSVSDLIQDFRKTRNFQLRADVISRHLPLVESLAKHFSLHGRGEPLEDLIQVGSIGLIKAVDEFDAAKDARFTTYAAHRIAGEIRHYLRDKAQTIRPPRWLRYLTYQIYAEAEALAQTLGRFPNAREIADRLNMTEEGVEEIFKTGKNLSCRSLDASAPDAWEKIQKKIRSKHLVSFQLPLEDKIMLFNAVEKLLEIEKEALFLSFFQDLTQTEIGKKLGMSQRAVSRLIQKGLSKLKEALR